MSVSYKFTFLDDNFFAMKMFTFQVLNSLAANVHRKEDKNRKGNKSMGEEGREEGQRRGRKRKMK